MAYTTPAPPFVYYDAERVNFYDERGKAKGTGFFRLWYKRRDEFQKFSAHRATTAIKKAREQTYAELA